jgi:hypothetical protein
MFDIMEKSSKILHRNHNTSVSSANKMGSDKVFIVGGRSFMCIMKSKSPKIDRWGTPCFTVPHFEKKFSNNFISLFCFLFVR